MQDMKEKWKITYGKLVHEVVKQYNGKNNINEANVWLCAAKYVIVMLWLIRGFRWSNNTIMAVGCCNFCRKCQLYEVMGNEPHI